MVLVTGVVGVGREVGTPGSELVPPTVLSRWPATVARTVVGKLPLVRAKDLAPISEKGASSEEEILEWIFSR